LRPESASIEASLYLKREHRRLREAIHRGDASQSVSNPRCFVDRRFVGCVLPRGAAQHGDPSLLRRAVSLPELREGRGELRI
jgi:hypothetical protein